MPTYFKLTEWDGNEDETWRFFIPLTATQAPRRMLADLVAWACEPEISVSGNTYEERDVNFLVEEMQGEGAYMDAVQKLGRPLDLAKVEALQELPAEDVYAALYKGGVRDLLQNPQ